jgi:uncharacterized protein DUF3540
MTSTVTLVGERATRTSSEQYLGPACVTEVHGQSVTIELPGGETAAAQLALAFLYQPVPGDVLLVIGREETYYGIGVLHGTGKTVLAFHGDVELRAVDGALNLAGDRGVNVEGPKIEMHTGKLSMIAESVVQKFSSVFQRVSSLLSVHAGKSHTIVDGASFTQAESGAIVTKEIMTINGKQIHLG